MNWIIICILGFVTVIPAVQGHVNNKIPECNKTMAHKGVILCDEAFERALNYNREAIIASPKRHGCCISQNIHPCYNYSFTQAKCALHEYKVLELIAAKQREFQKMINIEANYLGNTNCNYMHWKRCEHLFDEYAKTMFVIQVMNNGANSIQKLSYLVMTMLILKHFTRNSFK